MRHAKDTYIKYQKYKNLAAFHSTANKGFEYVKRFLQE